MQHKDATLLNKVFAYLEDTYFEQFYCPTLSEVAKKFNISKTSAYNYVTELKKSGRLYYDGKKVITEKTRKMSQNINAPLFMQSIPCGGLEALDNGIDGYVSLSTLLFPGFDDLFVATASGDSMIDAGIVEGDRVVLSKNLIPKDGDIVAALDGEGNSTLKRLKIMDGKYVLHPENDKYEDIEVDHLEVQGVLKFVIHDV